MQNPVLFYRKRLTPLTQWVFIVLALIMIGVIGFMTIEGFGLIDACYMVIITITTIGYGEVYPLSQHGRLFNIGFIIISFSTITYFFAWLTRFILSGDMTRYYAKKRLMQTLEKMHNHVIICGYGRNGRQAAKTLRAHGIEFVVIEKDSDTIKDQLYKDESLVYLAGDATDDETLVKAGVQRARAILVALPADADNVFIVLSARTLNPGLQIISRAAAQSAVAKLHTAGANSVIMPDAISGTHMATLVSKPDVIEFIDFLSGEGGEAIHIESVSCDKLPPSLHGKSIEEIMAWKKTGVTCIGIKDENGSFLINPPNSTLLSKRMKVIVLGTKEQISKMHHNVE